MGHTYTTTLSHIVFSTKERRSLIPAAKLHELWAYTNAIARNHGIEVLAIGGISDHLHILANIPSSVALATAVQKIKANSSRWMSTQVPYFEWQKGYGAFSVSPSQVAPVKAYIWNQGVHHEKRDFKAEFLVLLRRAGIAFDPERTFD